MKWKKNIDQMPLIFLTRSQKMRKKLCSRAMHFLKLGCIRLLQTDVFMSGWLGDVVLTATFIVMANAVSQKGY